METKRTVAIGESLENASSQLKNALVTASSDPSPDYDLIDAITAALRFVEGAQEQNG